MHVNFYFCQCDSKQIVIFEDSYDMHGIVSFSPCEHNIYFEPPIPFLNYLFVKIKNKKFSSSGKSTSKIISVCAK